MYIFSKKIITPASALILPNLRIHLLDWIGQDLERENVVRDHWGSAVAFIYMEHLNDMFILNTYASNSQCTYIVNLMHAYVFNINISLRTW